MAGHGEAIPMRSRAGRPLTGVAEVPGDKSVSHRALILGALAVGRTEISGLLEGQDVLDTGKAMRAFGARVEREGPGVWVVDGVGVGGFREPEDVIDLFRGQGSGALGMTLGRSARFAHGVATAPLPESFRLGLCQVYQAVMTRSEWTRNKTNKRAGT